MTTETEETLTSLAANMMASMSKEDLIECIKRIKENPDKIDSFGAMLEEIVPCQIADFRSVVKSSTFLQERTTSEFGSGVDFEAIGKQLRQILYNKLIERKPSARNDEMLEAIIEGAKRS